MKNLPFKKFFHRFAPLLIVGFVLIISSIIGVFYVKKVNDNPLGNGSIISNNISDSESFDSFLDETFRTLIVKDTLTLHFSLKNPESLDITSIPNCFSPIRYDEQLNTYQFYEQLLTTMKQFHYSKLSFRQQYTYDILKAYLTSALSMKDDIYYQEPLSSVSGIHIQLPILLCEYSFYNKDDIEEYLNLLDTIDIYFQDIYVFEQEKSNAGLFMSDTSLTNVSDFCYTFANETKNSPLITSFNQRITNCSFLSDLEKEKYMDYHASLVLDKVLPSYSALADKLQDFAGTSTNDGGLCHFEEGRNYYCNLVHHVTGTSQSMYALFQKINHARSEDISVMADLFSKDPTLSSQCNSYEFTQMEPDAMLLQLQNAMKRDFPECQDSCNTISTVDSALQDYCAPAFYLIAPMDDYLNNVIYYNPSKCNSSLDLFTTLAHEGYPGHLYQTVMSYEYGLEPIRSLLSFPGYTEGWATYVEMLSYHYTGMDSDLATVFEHNYAVLLSLYASADIGIHYYGWNLEHTTNFFAEFGIKDSDVIAEIYQAIIEEPGNYLKYYIGYLNFAELHDKYENVPLKDFHKAILSIGPAPFDIVDDYLKSYLSLQ